MPDNKINSTMASKKVYIDDTRPAGDNKDQGLGGGDDTRPTTSARGGAIAPDTDTKSTSKDHLTPPREDVNGPRTAERGGHNRVGHQPHNPAEAKDKAGNPKGNDRVQTKR